MNENLSTARDPYWDTVKGLLIFLVLLGHCIQFIHLGNNFYAHPLFKAIYLFHMPLFALISGYFAYGSIQRRGRKYLVNSTIHLLVPSITVAIISIIKTNYHCILQGSELIFDHYDIYAMWFLICIYECSIFLYIAMQHQSWWWRGFWFLAPILVAVYCQGFPLADCFVFLCPFYLIGVLTRGVKIDFSNKWITLAALLVFVGVYSIFYPYWYVYRFPLCYGHTDTYAFIVAGIRFAGGISGCILFLSCIKRVPFMGKLRCMAEVGKYTLAIYVLQTLFFTLVWKADYPKLELPYCIALAVALLIILYFCALLMRKNRVVRLLFFGETK